jgi:hypothetical protein
LEYLPSSLPFAAAFAAIATFRYELAIMLPEKESSAVNLLRLSFIITVLLTALSFLFILLFSRQLTNLALHP